MPLDEFGVYSVGVALALVAAGFHNVLVAEPTVVLGARLPERDLCGYLRNVARLHWVVVLSGLVIFAGGALLMWGRGQAWPRTLLCAAVALPGMLGVWQSRRIVYILDRRYAMWLSLAIFSATAIGGVVVLRKIGILGAITASVITGAAGMLAWWIVAAGVLRRGGVEPGGAPAVSATVRDHWRYGGWMLAAALFGGLGQGLAAPLLGSCGGFAAAGVFRAVENVLGPMHQGMTAAGVALLPVFVRRHESSGSIGLMRLVRRVSAISLAASCALLVALYLFGADLLAWIYGRTELAEWGMAVLLLSIPLLFRCVADMGIGMALRAVGNTKGFFWSVVCGGVAGIAATVTLVPSFGVWGAAWSRVIQSAVQAGVLALMYEAET